jgi:hypothetical protein
MSICGHCSSSSLAINCCQFALFSPSGPVTDTKFSGGDTSGWMKALTKQCPDMKVRDIIVPGTHDSASYTISSLQLFSAVGRTQNLSVQDQLLAGARYIDVRVANAKKRIGLSIWHGCLEGGAFMEVLEEVEEFLKNHEQEFVVLELVPEYGRPFARDARMDMLKSVHQQLGSRAVPADQVENLLSSWTLKNLAESGKQVVVLLHPRFYEDFQLSQEEIASTYNMASSRKWMHGKWHNTRQIGQLLDRNLEFVQKHGKNQKQLLNNQFILTPGVGSASDVLNALIGQNSLQPVSWARKLYKDGQLATYLREHADEPWNIFMLDFIELCPTVVHFAVGLNFPSELTVLLAAVWNSSDSSDGSIDVTEKLIPFVKRDRILLLTSIVRDLELNFDEGVLTIAYCVKDVYHVMSLDFEASSQALLSGFSHNDDALVVIIDGPAAGFISRDQMCPRKEDLRGKAATVLEYDCTDAQYDFKITL